MTDAEPNQPPEPPRSALFSRAALTVTFAVNVLLLIAFFDYIYPLIIGLDLSERWRVENGWSGTVERGELRVDRSGFFVFAVEDGPDFALRRIRLTAALSEHGKFDIVLRDRGDVRTVFRVSRSSLYLPGVFREGPDGNTAVASLLFQPEPNVRHQFDVLRVGDGFMLAIDGAEATSVIVPADAAGRFGLSGVRGGVTVSAVELDGEDARGEAVAYSERFGWGPATVLWRLVQTLLLANAAIAALLVLWRIHRFRIDRLRRTIDAANLAGINLAWYRQLPGALIVAGAAAGTGALLARSGSTVWLTAAAVVFLGWIVFSLVSARIMFLPWRNVLAADAYSLVPLAFWVLWCGWDAAANGGSAEVFAANLWKTVPVVFLFKLYILAGFFSQARAQSVTVALAVLVSVPLTEAALHVMPADRFLDTLPACRELARQVRIRMASGTQAIDRVSADHPADVTGAEPLSVLLVGLDPRPTVHGSDGADFVFQLAGRLADQLPSRWVDVEADFLEQIDKAVVSTLDVRQVLDRRTDQSRADLMVTLFGTGDGSPSLVWPLTNDEFRIRVLRDGVPEPTADGFRLGWALREQWTRVRGAVTPTLSRFRFVPQVTPEQFETNADAICRKALDGGRRMVLVKPPLLSEYVAYETRPGETTDPYLRALGRVGERHEVPVLDANLMLFRRRGVAFFSAPTTLTSEGLKVLAEEMAADLAAIVRAPRQSGPVETLDQATPLSARD